jgi:hypothetical protein
VLVLDDGFSWQNTHYRSLSAIARKITGMAWSGPLFTPANPGAPRNDMGFAVTASEAKESR